MFELVPTDQTGQAFVSDSWDISTTLEAPTSVAATLDSQRVQPADNRSAAAAIHIDNSGSMLQSDPDRRRATAAQLFWNELLGAGTGNIVALLDFGRGTPDTPSPGFRTTRLLQSFTPDASRLAVKLPSIQAAPGGGTRLYRSAREVARWFDTTVAATAYKRTVVIITDGLPRDTLGYKDSLFATTAAAQIRILAVGVGPASVPPRGTRVAGTVTIAEKRGRATAGWSFIAP